MKLRNVLLLFPILLTQISCDEDKIDYFESPTIAKEVSIPSSVKINDQFSIAMVVYGSSGCSEFSRFELSIIGDTTIFDLYQYRDKDLTCTTEIIEINTSIEISLTGPGTKFLVFNEGTEFEILDSLRITN